MRSDGAIDVVRAAEALASRLPPALAPFAHLAFNYRWSWAAGGPELFRAIDPERWEASEENPVRLLQETSRNALARAAGDRTLTADARALLRAVRTETATPARSGGLSPERPVAFLCTEFGIHRSLPLYAGGLGVLAGDVLKEASDSGVPLVGVGLFYRQGYFHQRLDASGWQHEYWTWTDPHRTAAVRVSREDGVPLTIRVPVRGRDVVAQVWRVEVGRVPLFLLDTYRPENSPIDRWITSRLYVSDRRFRLAQYAMLGFGAVRALEALGIDPGIVHLNEGHAALAPLDLVRRSVQAGRSFEQALEEVRARTVFTTHTPVAAGNESFEASEALEVLGNLPADAGVDAKDVLALGRARPLDDDEPFGLTPLGLRMSRTANGVSRLHGEVARQMWQHLHPGSEVSDVPIRHITNGVHLPTWMAPAMRSLLTRHFGEGWETRAADPATWEAVDGIPDEELWTARNELRAELVSYASLHAANDRLSRGEPAEYAEAALAAFHPQRLTLGFARRVASYKRLWLLTYDPTRALRLLDDPEPIQVLLAGKPHPQDEEAKHILQRVFELKWGPHVSERVAFLEDYDLAVATKLVRGCDVWINVPRPPLEASGTSGMKSAFNGGLNLSVLDGWWAEAYDGENGWAIEGDVSPDAAAQDARHAGLLYDILEREVIPLFNDRDESGVPRGWVRKIKASLRTIGPRFAATRMLHEYTTQAYRSGA